MIPMGIIKYLFLAFILNQMLIIYALKEQENIDEVSINTEYLVGNLNLTWSIADYSQIFGTVHTIYTHRYTQTIWELILEDKKRIYLKRLDFKEPVLVDVNFTLITQNKTFQGEKRSMFPYFDNRTITHLLTLDVKDSKSVQHFDSSDSDNLNGFTEKIDRKRKRIPIVFENDVFILEIKMKILGPETSERVKQGGEYKILNNK